MRRWRIIVITLMMLLASQVAAARPQSDPARAGETGTTEIVLRVRTPAPGTGPNYGEPYQGRYQTHNVYWFSWGGTGSPLMATRTVTPEPTAPVVTQITRTLHLENDRR